MPGSKTGVLTHPATDREFLFQLIHTNAQNAHAHGTALADAESAFPAPIATKPDSSRLHLPDSSKPALPRIPAIQNFVYRRIQSKPKIRWGYSLTFLSISAT